DGSLPLLQSSGQGIQRSCARWDVFTGASVPFGLVEELLQAGGFSFLLLQLVAQGFQALQCSVQGTDPVQLPNLLLGARQTRLADLYHGAVAPDLGRGASQGAVDNTQVHDLIQFPTHLTRRFFKPERRV